MKGISVTLCLLTALFAHSVLRAAQNGTSLPAPPKGYKRIFTVGPHKTARLSVEQAQLQADTSKTIPLWNYRIVSPVDGGTYTGSIVGRNPYFHGHRTTAIPVYLVPVRLTFADTGTVFDPTVNTGCDSNSVLKLVENSPVFQNASYTMNGANVGTTQYIDAFQRANFWEQVAGTPYHTALTLNVTGTLSVTVPVGSGATNGFFTCLYGTMDINWWDNLVQTQLLPALANQGIGATSLPAFIFDSVFEYENGDPSQCCVLGYHNSETLTSGALQTYSITSWDTSGTFGGDISITTHEVGEWLNDPNTVNATPSWGHIGQVSGCQNNYEVGDALTGTTFPTVTLNNYNYNPQELVFFSWFFRQSPSVGSGELYSNNGSFNTVQSSVCQ